MRPFSTSPLRRLASALVLCMLTGNIAMAAYICPNLAAMMEVAEPASHEMAAMPCTGMEVEKPAQCVQFQSGEQLALEHLAAAALTPATAGSIVTLEILPARQIASPPPREAPLLASTGPPYLQTQRLRI